MSTRPRTLVTDQGGRCRSRKPRRLRCTSPALGPQMPAGRRSANSGTMTCMRARRRCARHARTRTARRGARRTAGRAAGSVAVAAALAGHVNRRRRQRRSRGAPSNSRCTASLPSVFAAILEERVLFRPDDAALIGRRSSRSCNNLSDTLRYVERVGRVLRPVHFDPSRGRSSGPERACWEWELSSGHL